MGWKLTGVNFLYDRRKATVIADGNNAAWCCPCGMGPILFIYLEGRIGSHEDIPSRCPNCNNGYYLDPQFIRQHPDRSVRPVDPPGYMKIRQI